MSSKMTSDFVPLNEPWLKTFHINKYVSPVDKRIFNRPVCSGNSAISMKNYEHYRKAVRYIEIREKLLDKRRNSFTYNVRDTDYE